MGVFAAMLAAHMAVLGLRRLGTGGHLRLFGASRGRSDWLSPPRSGTRRHAAAVPSLLPPARDTARLDARPAGGHSSEEPGAERAQPLTQVHVIVLQPPVAR